LFPTDRNTLELVVLSLLRFDLTIHPDEYAAYAHVMSRSMVAYNTHVMNVYQIAAISIQQNAPTTTCAVTARPDSSGVAAIRNEFGNRATDAVAV
jgi:hypothetical protein